MRLGESVGGAEEASAGSAGSAVTIPSMPSLPPELVSALRENVGPVDEATKMKGTSVKILRKSKGLLQTFQPVITPIAQGVTLLPCTMAQKYAQLVCQPTMAIQQGLGAVLGLVGGSDKPYKRTDYRKIYDPLTGRHHSIRSKRGKAVLMSYYGYVIYQNSLNHLKYLSG